jgi:hypothetical protein
MPWQHGPQLVAHCVPLAHDIAADTGIAHMAITIKVATNLA